jgi:hypothetical protein|tara:strand:- start:1395 stop:1604 length:210 start_codon:yes stop_codon:yes gene_type:complete
VRVAIRSGRISNPKVASRLSLYTLAKELHISPKEVFELPFSLVQELLMVHSEVESYKADELEKQMNKIK